ncbi:hypothetical protein M885DRAFT_567416 [Pelagophyceae sp. CCMP2097]|nr:hypothetical protein M885DRAFT_567416 [Pelagophyceae sp. CCMP2097]
MSAGLWGSGSPLVHGTLTALRRRVGESSAPDLRWADDDKLDDVDDDADAVLQMAASATAQRRAASAAAQRRAAPSMQSPRRMGESAEEVKNFGQENRQAAEGQATEAPQDGSGPQGGSNSVKSIAGAQRLLADEGLLLGMAALDALLARVSQPLPASPR